MMKRIMLMVMLAGLSGTIAIAAPPTTLPGKVLHKGQSVSNANNLQQLAQLLIQYADSHNGRFPVAGGASGLATLKLSGATNKMLISSSASETDKLTEANASCAYLGNVLGEVSKLSNASAIPLLIEKSALASGGEVQIAYCDGHVATKRFGATNVAGVVLKLMKESGNEKDPVWAKLSGAAAAIDAATKLK